MQCVGKINDYTAILFGKMFKKKTCQKTAFYVVLLSTGVIIGENTKENQIRRFQC